MPPTPTAKGRRASAGVRTSLVTEDPDFDIVRYRYRWSVGGKLVRAVQSAALSDVLRRGARRTGKSVRCTVTPSDGRLSGPTVVPRDCTLALARALGRGVRAVEDHEERQ